MRVTDTVYSRGEPVSEQRARALAINEVLREPLSEFLDKQVKRLKLFVGAGAALTVLGLVAVGVGVPIGAVGIIVGLAVAGGGYYYVQTREPAVEITGMTKGYWTGYSIPSKDGVLFYDATATVRSSEFELEQIADRQQVSEAKETLENMEDFPVVMSEQNNIEDEFTSVLNNVQREIEGTESSAVHAPVLRRNSPEARAITSLVGRADAESVPVATAVGPEQAKEDLEDLSELGNLAEENPVEDDLETLSGMGQTTAEDLSGHVDDAIEQLNEHIQTAADAFGIVSYNFYCPDCHGDDIESRLVMPDDRGEEVYCQTCRGQFSREAAIPRHKIKDDIVLPTWDQLWAEKAEKKQEIYQNIEDQKHELEEREYEQRREEIRTANERIRDLRSKIRDLKTQAQAAQGTVNEIGELMVKYDRLNKERKEEFSRDVNQAYDEIDNETEQLLEETRSNEQERLEQAEAEAKEKAEMLRVEEQQAQAEMIAAQQEIAQAQMAHSEQMTQAQIQAEAAMTESLLEQQEKHHRDNWMLKTRGETSFSDTIDNMKMKKDQMLGASVRGD